MSRVWLVTGASSGLGLAFNFAGLFLYVAAAPVFLTEHLGLGPDQFGWLFIPAVAGIFLGALAANRVLAAMLFEVSPTDVVTFGSVAALNDTGMPRASDSVTVKLKSGTGSARLKVIVLPSQVTALSYAAVSLPLVT